MPINSGYLWYDAKANFVEISGSKDSNQNSSKKEKLKNMSKTEFTRINLNFQTVKRILPAYIAKTRNRSSTPCLSEEALFVDIHQKQQGSGAIKSSWHWLQHMHYHVWVTATCNLTGKAGMDADVISTKGKLMQKWHGSHSPKILTAIVFSMVSAHQQSQFEWIS